MARNFPSLVRVGSTVYFLVDKKIRYAAVVVSMGRVPDHWMKLWSAAQKTWVWKPIGNDIFVEVIGFRHVDDIEEHQPTSPVIAWIYIQLDPSEDQRQVNEELLHRYLQEKENEWRSQQMGS